MTGGKAAGDRKRRSRLGVLAEEPHLENPVIESAADDAELVAGVLAGDALAASQLFGRHTAYMRKVARSRLWPGCGSDVVEDVVAVAQGRAWERLGQLSDPAKFKKWYAQIVRREAAGESRREARRRTDLYGTLPETAVSAAQEGGSDREDRVQAAFSAMPERHRNALTASLIEGQSPEDLAEQLQIERNAANQLTHRAKISLAKRYLNQADAGVAPACRSCISRTSEYFRARDPQLRQSIDRHLAGCATCRTHYSQALADLQRLSPKVLTGLILVGAASAVADRLRRVGHQARSSVLADRVVFRYHVTRIALSRYKMPGPILIDQIQSSPAVVATAATASAIVVGVTLFIATPAHHHHMVSTPPPITSPSTAAPIAGSGAVVTRPPLTTQKPKAPTTFTTSPVTGHTVTTVPVTTPTTTTPTQGPVLLTGNGTPGGATWIGHPSYAPGAFNGKAAFEFDSQNGLVDPTAAPPSTGDFAIAFAVEQPLPGTDTAPAAGSGAPTSLVETLSQINPSGLQVTMSSYQPPGQGSAVTTVSASVTPESGRAITFAEQAPPGGGGWVSVEVERIGATLDLTVDGITVSQPLSPTVDLANSTFEVNGIVGGTPNQTTTLMADIYSGPIGDAPQIHTPPTAATTTIPVTTTTVPVTTTSTPDGASTTTTMARGGAATTTTMPQSTTTTTVPDKSAPTTTLPPPAN
jgi:RNA polymerase sigma factor (sigma-70 family)